MNSFWKHRLHVHTAKKNSLSWDYGVERGGQHPTAIHTSFSQTNKSKRSAFDLNT